MQSYEERTKDFTFTQQDENEIAQMVIVRIKQRMDIPKKINHFSSMSQLSQTGWV